MILGINVRILDQASLRGWSRYSCNLIRGICKKNIEIKFFSDKPIEMKWIPKERHKDVYVESSFSYISWEQVVLKRMAEKNGVSLLHCPTNYGLPYFGKFRKVLTLHDAIESSYYGKFVTLKDVLSGLHFKNRLLHKISQQSADRIITVSEFAKKDIVNTYGVSASKISVIYEAADDSIGLENVKSETVFVKQWGISPGYFFYVGGLENRKNIPFLINLAKQNPQKNFVIAGGGDNSHIKVVPTNVKLLGFLPEEWLSSFYHYSKAFVYPSFQEGFGLQMVESIKLGKPVLYANTSSLQEVYGSDMYGFNPSNLDEAQSKLNHLEMNYDAAVAYAKERSSFFSWEKTVDETLRVYNSF